MQAIPRAVNRIRGVLRVQYEIEKEFDPTWFTASAVPPVLPR